MSKIKTKEVQEHMENIRKQVYDFERNSEAMSLELCRQTLVNIRENINTALDLLENGVPNNGDAHVVSDFLAAQKRLEDLKDFEQAGGVIERARTDADDGAKVIQGVFNGEVMVASDDATYKVPVNYASKSKLVEGDVLKLTILRNGTFKYKQINPVNRKRLIGTLVHDADNDVYYATLHDKQWRVLNASISFFRGNNGDDIVFLIPKDGISQWAAVENIISDSIADQVNDMFDQVEAPAEDDQDGNEQEPQGVWGLVQKIFG